MHIDQIPLDHLSVSKANMRAGKKPPDISDILPSIIKRGVISPLFVRPNCNPGHRDRRGHTLKHSRPSKHSPISKSWFDPAWVESRQMLQPE